MWCSTSAWKRGDIRDPKLSWKPMSHIISDSPHSPTRNMRWGNCRENTIGSTQSCVCLHAYIQLLELILSKTHNFTDPCRVTNTYVYTYEASVGMVSFLIRRIWNRTSRVIEVIMYINRTLLKIKDFNAFQLLSAAVTRYLTLVFAKVETETCFYDHVWFKQICLVSVEA